MNLPLLVLAGVGVAEAWAHTWRYRAAGENPRLSAALSCFVLTGLRIGFVGLGVGLLMQGHSFHELLAVYALPASIATYFCHKPPRTET